MLFKNCPQMETDQTMTLATICIMAGTTFQDDRHEWSRTFAHKTYSLVNSSLWLLPPWKFIQLSDTMTGQCLGLLTGQAIMQTILGQFIHLMDMTISLHKIGIVVQEMTQ